jgi:desulfoferrodoxin (superoxide reductase-like protein)
MHEYSLELFNTDLRWICLLWRHDTLSRLSFYHDSAAAAKTIVETEFGQAVSLKNTQTTLARALTRYAAGD